MFSLHCPRCAPFPVTRATVYYTTCLTLKQDDISISSNIYCRPVAFPSLPRQNTQFSALICRNTVKHLIVPVIFAGIIDRDDRRLTMLTGPTVMTGADRADRDIINVREKNGSGFCTAEG